MTLNRIQITRHGLFCEFCDYPFDPGDRAYQEDGRLYCSPACSTFDAEPHKVGTVKAPPY